MRSGDDRLLARCRLRAAYAATFLLLLLASWRPTVAAPSEIGESPATTTTTTIDHHHHHHRCHHHLFAQNRSWTTRPDTRHLQLPTI